jgi:hypothetical protein
MRPVLLAFVGFWVGAWGLGVVAHCLGFFPGHFRAGGSPFQSWAGGLRVLFFGLEPGLFLFCDLSILEVRDVVHVRFVRDFSSSHITAVGVGGLFFTHGDGRCAIICGSWSRLFSPPPATLRYAYLDSGDSALYL